MKKLGSILLFSLPTIALLALLEWLAGMYLKDRFENFDLEVQATGQMAPNGYQLWEHPANYTSWSKISRFNNLGFRRFEDTPVQKPRGVTRVFILGGSGALGSPANPAYPYLQMSGQASYSADLAISAHLERILNDRHAGTTFEVINAATNWSQLHQQMLHYFRKIRYLEPDLIISIDGQNDAIGIDPPFRSMWDFSSVEKVNLLESNLRVAVRPLITRSNLLYLMAASVLGERETGRIPNDQALVDQYKDLGKPADFDEAIAEYARVHEALLERGVGEYVDHLQHFADALQRDEVKWMFIQQPQLIMDESKSLTDIERALKNYMYRGDPGYEVNFFSMVEARGNALRENEGFNFWSFLNIFQHQAGEVYVDYTHLTPEGNEFLAQHLAGLIETRYPEMLAPRIDREGGSVDRSGDVASH